MSGETPTWQSGTAQPSWILELRDRLGSQPRSTLSGDDPRVVFFVPLYVENGQLWTILLQDSAPRPPEALAPIGFPARESPLDVPPWSAAARAAAELLGVAPDQILRLGELGERRGLGKIRYLPCVGAIPSPQALPAGEIEYVTLPLLAIGSPQLTETRRLEIAGEVAEVEVAHVGPHRLWGPAAEILDDLLSRLGLSH